MYIVSGAQVETVRLHLNSATLKRENVSESRPVPAITGVTVCLYRYLLIKGMGMVTK